MANPWALQNNAAAQQQGLLGNMGKGLGLLGGMFSGFDPNAFSQGMVDNQGALMGLASGILGGQDMRQGLAQGLNNFQQGRAYDTQRNSANQTKLAALAYAKQAGMTPQQIEMIGASKEAQQAVLQQMFAPPKDPYEVSAGASLIDRKTLKPIYQAPAAGGGEFGLTAVYGRDPTTGKTVLGQIGKNGVFHVPQIPGNFEVTGNYSSQDLGTGIGAFNKRTGQMEGPVTPKDIAGAESQKVQGEAQGAAAANLPAALSQADQALQTIKDIRTAKGTGWIPHTGIFAAANAIPGTDGYDFQRKVDQLQGQTFLQAYNQLKGAGAITDIEGKKASDALTAISTGMSGPAFDKALKDLEGVIVSGKSRLAQKASARPVPPGGGVGAPQAPSPTGPQPGDVDGGYRFKGGDPGNQANWEPAQ